MTACVNKKHTRRVSAVVTASLVGALSIGAPAVALAQGNDGIQVLGDQQDALAGGKVTAWTDQDGDECSNEFTYDGAAHYIVPTEVTPLVGSKIDPTDEGYHTYYYKVVSTQDANVNDRTPDGEWLQNIADPSTIKDEGTYVVAVVKDGAAGAIEGAQFEFKIVGNKLENARVVRTKDDTSSKFIYNGLAQERGTEWIIMLGDKPLNNSNGLGDVKIYKDGKPEEIQKPCDAGDYTVHIIGNHDYAGQEADIHFTISPVDLATAPVEFGSNAVEYEKLGGSSVLPDFASKIGDITFDHVTITDLSGVSEADDAAAGVNGISDNNLIASLEYLPEESSSEAPVSNAVGKYVYKLTVKNENGSECTNVTGERKLTFVRYQKDADITYDGQPADGESTLHFNKDYIDVRTTGGKKLDYSVEYYKDVDGAMVPVEESKTQFPGDYEARITVSDDTYEWGGKATVRFTVNAIDIEDVKAFVTYKGEVVNDNTTVDVYSGDDLMANLGIKAFDIDDNVVPEGEFDLVVKDKSGKAVSELTEAGTYTAEIQEKEDSMYRLTAPVKVTFTVKPVVIDKANPDNNADLAFAGTRGFGDKGDITYVYTGSPIVPSFVYDVTWGAYKDSVEWVALPADSYKLSYEKYNENAKQWVKVDECVEPGRYAVTLKDSAKDGNHIVNDSREFYISDTGVFSDVPNSHWAAKDIYNAVVMSYMKGYDGTTFFGPADSLTRGQAAVVLFNMAGGSALLADGNNSQIVSELESVAFNSYSDMEPGDVNSWAAAAVGWATQTGVVKGNGDGTFAPAEKITREQFAIMLANYAELKGDYETVNADEVLSGVAGGDEVDPWAKQEVAWAVSEGIMGQGSELWPTGTIERAQVATMVVRFQPDGVEDILSPRE